MTTIKSMIRRRVFEPLVKKFTLPFADMVASQLALSENNIAQFIFERHGWDLIRRHYYSPIPDPADLPDDYWSRLSEMPGVDMNDPACLDLMNAIVAPRMDEFRERFPTEQDQSRGPFFLLNSAYMAVDAHVYWSLIRALRPRRIVEIGAGYSTLVASAACELNREQGLPESELIAIEPYPWEAYKRGWPGLTKLIPTRLQQVPMETFTDLRDGDILFIDSSHVLRAGNDVQMEYLEILPRLAEGVLVHIHDISLPEQYPKCYYDRQFYWNEQELLQAFLAFNSRFEVVWAGNHMLLRHPEQVMRVFPEISDMRAVFPDSEPTAFWMRVRGGRPIHELPDARDAS